MHHSILLDILFININFNDIHFIFCMENQSLMIIFFIYYTTIFVQPFISFKEQIWKENYLNDMSLKIWSKIQNSFKTMNFKWITEKLQNIFFQKFNLQSYSKYFGISNSDLFKTTENSLIFLHGKEKKKQKLSANTVNFSTS